MSEFNLEIESVAFGDRLSEWIAHSFRVEEVAIVRTKDGEVTRLKRHADRSQADTGNDGGRDIVAEDETLETEVVGAFNPCVEHRVEGKLAVLGALVIAITFGHESRKISVGVGWSPSVEDVTISVHASVKPHTAV